MPDRLDAPSFFFHFEDYKGPESRVRGFRRYVWLRTALEGRRTAKAALQAGCSSICMFALGHAVFLPRTKKAKYFIYGDSTLQQMDRLYYHEEWDNSRKRFFRKHLRKLTADGHQFLCMSNWYRDGLLKEYGASPNQAILLRPPIDTDLWQPGAAAHDGRPRMLFIGGDFERKGGKLLLDLAEDKALAGVDWHFVTNEAGQDTERVHFHRGLKPDTPELIDLVRSCDLLVLPTTADCYSHAAIEAGACGLPSVITDVGGIGDIVTTGVNGTLLQDAKPETVKHAVVSYLEQPAKLKQEGDEARRLVVERNSVSLHADQLASALKS